MITIACVLKLGEWNNANKKVEYKEAYVRWLHKQIKQYVTIPHKFVCLTDSKKLEDVAIPLKHNYPGWWSKIELFRPDLALHDVFYLDLDTVIVDNINHIVSSVPDCGFRVLRNMSTKKKNTRKIGSGLMRWKGDYSYLFNNFTPDLIPNYNTSEKWGDQGYIQDSLPSYDFFQEHFVNEVVSWKVDLNGVDKKPENKIVVFHGLPKPHEVKRKWILEME